MRSVPSKDDRFKRWAVTSEAPAPGRRTTFAFLCALALVVVSMITVATDVRSVLAFGDESAAAFFRADRLRQQGSRPPASAAGPAGGSGRQLTVAVPLNPPLTRPGTLGPATVARLPEAQARPGERGPAPLTRAPASAIGGRSVCVRLCDGYHFPVGDAPSSGNVAAHESICSATCPGAPTRLYVIPAGTDDIGRAVSVRDGRAYHALPVALRHAGKRDNTCSCRRNNESQAALVSLYRDFTLRSGDVVMTQKGFRVFRGSTQWPYKSKDFAGLNASRLSAAERRLLQRIERASAPVNASFIERPRSTPRSIASPDPALGPFPVNRSDRARAAGGERTHRLARAVTLPAP